MKPQKIAPATSYNLVARQVATRDSQRYYIAQPFYRQENVGGLLICGTGTPNLPTKIIPAKIR